jgi:hypothetical protein
VEITEEIAQSFKVKVKNISNFVLVWNSSDTQSQAQVSIWAPNLQTSYNRVRLRPYSSRGLVPHCVSQARICLGYYASKGFSNPLKQRGAGRFQNIEVTDYATLRRKRSKVLSAVLAMACPHPRTTRVRFSPSLKYSYIDVFGLFYFCREVQASLAFRAWGAVDVCVEGHSSGGIHRHGDGGHHHRGGP